jgi:hypothetical protein
MATSINLGYSLYLDGSTITGLLGRQNHVAASFYNTGSGGLQVRSGVLPGAGQMKVTPGSGLQVIVASGAVVVANSSGSTFGGYLFSMMSSGTLTVATADPTNPRVDLICATVSDVGTSSSFAEVQIITGTPAPSPTTPAVPANSLALAAVLVPANASSILAGNINTAAALTVAAGGVLPSPASSAPAGYNGAYLHDLTSGSLKHNSATGVVQAHVLPFSPQVVAVTSNVSVPQTPSQVTVSSISFTSDGATDWEFAFSAPDLTNNTVTIEVALFLDSTQLYAFNTLSGFFQIMYTQAGLSTTPSAGSHTLSLISTGVTGTNSIIASPTAPIQLRAAPVPL